MKLGNNIKPDIPFFLNFRRNIVMNVGVNTWIFKDAMQKTWDKTEFNNKFEHI